MKIITVRFTGSGKTYDYLFVNPTKCPIDEKKPLLVPTGASGGKTFNKVLHLVTLRKEEVLPSWVTAQIVVQGGNICNMEKIPVDRLHELRYHKSTTPTAPATPAKPKPKKEYPSYKSVLDEMEERYQQILKDAVEVTAKLFDL